MTATATTTTIDWDRVLELRRRFIAEGKLSRDELAYLTLAVKSDRRRYKAQNEAVLAKG